MTTASQRQSSDLATGRHCEGCGAELAPQTGGGPRRKWCSEKCRRTQYRGTCDTCGRPTDGSNGRDRAPTRCLDCLTWTPDAILEALRGWGDDHGGIPPRERDTVKGGAGHGILPNYKVMRRRFGSWNAALLAAGYEGLHKDRRPETQAAIEDAVRSGEKLADIGERFGVTAAAISMRLRIRGLSASQLRRTA